jgi:endonuclease III
MVALGAPVLPASPALVRVARRLGLAGRRATRLQTHQLASRNLAPQSYREFYSLAAEHAATRCRERKPECGACEVRALCRSKGRW